MALRPALGVRLRRRTHSGPGRIPVVAPPDTGPHAERGLGNRRHPRPGPGHAPPRDLQPQGRRTCPRQGHLPRRTKVRPAGVPRQTTRANQSAAAPTQQQHTTFDTKQRRTTDRHRQQRADTLARRLPTAHQTGSPPGARPPVPGHMAGKTLRLRVQERIGIRLRPSTVSS